ncbi:hypothetical protein Tco_0952498 [Tanacetum coccineum]|uniref:Uncharacterized protein n=1 Tax=Tanacetum coccineum TaxID=301880 RepID=A0ABQ5E019_9ASTR
MKTSMLSLISSWNMAVMQHSNVARALQSLNGIHLYAKVPYGHKVFENLSTLRHMDHSLKEWQIDINLSEDRYKSFLIIILLLLFLDGREKLLILLELGTKGSRVLVPDLVVMVKVSASALGVLFLPIMELGESSPETNPSAYNRFVSSLFESKDLVLKEGVDFLGAVIGEGTIKLQPHIIKKIVNFNEEELKTKKGLSGGSSKVPQYLSEEYEDHLRRSHEDFQPLPRIFTKTIFTLEEPGALYKCYQLKANQTPIRMDKSDA